MGCPDDSCYRGTHFEVRHRRCVGRGEVLSFQIGPLYVSLAKFWKPDLHARYARRDQDELDKMPLVKVVDA